MTSPTKPPNLPPLPPRRKAESSSRTAPSPWVLAILFASLGAVVAFVATILDSPVDDVPVSSLVVFPILMGFAFVLTRRAAAEETRFDLMSIMLTGFALRAFGTVLRYRAPVDAMVYHREGIRLADLMRGYDLFPDTGREIPGTGWIRYVSGIVHVIDLDDMMTSFLIFTFLAFIGAFLCYRAFVRAVPDGNHRRYALLIFLWPSLLYWPSSLGKEAWMIFGLGVGSWGVSRLVTGRAKIGIPVFALGLLIMALVRPHIALMAVVGCGIALLAQPGEKRSGARMAARLLSIALLLIGGAFLATKTSQLLKTDADGTEGVVQALDSTTAQTSQGGSAFKPPVVRTPLDYPWATMTVWFRPFPTEARSGGVPQLLSSAENMFLLGLIAVSWRRLRKLPKAIWRIPYVAYAFTYCLVFVYAFAAIGNFGILARQRTQGTIFFFVLICIPDLNTPADPLAQRRQRQAARLAGRFRRGRPDDTEAEPTTETATETAAGAGTGNDEGQAGSGLRSPGRRRAPLPSPTP